MIGKMTVRPTGLSCSGLVDPPDEFFLGMAKAGITHVELSSSIPDPSRQPDWDKVAARARKAGLTVWSLHLPFMPFQDIDISSCNEDLRIRSVQILTQIMTEAGKANIPHFIIHPSGEPIPEEERPKRLEAAKKSLSTLAGVAETIGAVLCVEDLPRTCISRSSADCLALCEADPRLRICFDTNHLLHEELSSFVKACGHLIVTLHVSDYDFLDEKHWMPGEGDINWTELMDLLDSIGYDGPFLYEFGIGPGKTPKSMAREHDLSFEDVKRNHTELEAREPLTVFGTRTGLPFGAK